MKSQGCQFCNDLRNISPAKYIGVPEEAPSEVIEFFKEARDSKSFILDTGDYFYITGKCPVCDYEFDEEDYDSYL